jgi:hypothetical protein
MQPEMIYSGQKPVDVITLDVFPYGDSKYDLYEDDNLSSSYKTGNFAITKISSSLKADGLTLKIAKPQGKFKPTLHQYELSIHWVNENPPKVVKENEKEIAQTPSSGAALKWRYDASKKILWIKSTASNESDITFKIN